jgi:hypothetical protein
MRPRWVVAAFVLLGAVGTHYFFTTKNADGTPVVRVNGDVT